MAVYSCINCNLSFTILLLYKFLPSFCFTEEIEQLQANFSFSNICFGGSSIENHKEEKHSLQCVSLIYKCAVVYLVLCSNNSSLNCCEHVAK